MLFFERKEDKERSDTFPISGFPPELSKKVNLLQYFINYMPRQHERIAIEVDHEAAAQKVEGRPVTKQNKTKQKHNSISNNMFFFF
jgi:hypothetical protein